MAALLRQHLLAAMARWGARIEAKEADAIHRFRRMHATALLVNLLLLVLLVLLVWATIQLSRAV